MCLAFLSNVYFSGQNGHFSLQRTFCQTSQARGQMLPKALRQPKVPNFSKTIKKPARFQLYFRACEALCQCLPDQLKDDTFAECLKDDKSTKHWLTLLLKNLDNMNTAGGGTQIGGGGGQGVAAIGAANKNLGGVKLPGGL